MMNIGELLWSTGLRKALTLLTALCGAVVAMPPAWTMIGLPEPASKVFVHEQVNPLKTAQADTTKAVWQLQLQNLRSSLYAAKLDQQKAPSPTVDQRVQDLEQEIQQTQTKINGSK